MDEQEKEVIREAVQAKLTLLRLMESEMGMVVGAELGNVSTLASRDRMIGANIMRAMVVEYLETGATFVLNDEESDEVINSWPSYPSAFVHENEIKPMRGFVHFSKPIPDPTGTPPLRPFTAFSWAVEPKEEALRTLVAGENSEIEFVLTIVGYSDPVHVLGPEFATSFPGSLYPCACVTWGLGDENGGILLSTSEKMIGLTDDRAVFVRILLAFFSLLHSDVLEETEPNTQVTGASNLLKNAARKAEKKRRKFNSDIMIVRYKPAPPRKPGKSYNKTDRKVGVRYRRGDFWKWVWFPSLDDHRLRRIRTHWSGPEDAPKVGYERVFRTPKPAKPKPVKPTAPKELE